MLFVVAICGFVLISGSSGVRNIDYDVFDTYSEADIIGGIHFNCSAHWVCAMIHPYTLCAHIPVDSESRNGTHCVCNREEGFFKKPGISDCVYHAHIGDTCDDKGGFSRCVDPHTECLHDGSNSGMCRCICKDRYDVFMIGGARKCVKMIHKGMDGTCAECEKNGGKCFDDDDDQRMNGCVCPVSQSGYNCQVSHVNVTCDADTFTMRVCYDTHIGVDLVASGMMATEGKTDYPACRAVLAGENETLCLPGQYKLVLPLAKGQREMCGTLEKEADIHIKKYETQIIVQKDKMKVDQDDIVFKTFCSFTTYTDTAFRAIGLKVINQNDRGEHKTPELALTVQNHLGKSIREGVALRLGDKIRLKIELTEDGTYSALLVSRCTASTKPTMPDPKAITMPLTIDSCPWAHQPFITVSNNFRRMAGRKNELQTGLIRMFKMPQGQSVHIHCAVKLCLSGSEDQCDIPNCASLRRKRASETEYVPRQRSLELMVSRELRWYEEPDAGSKNGKPIIDFDTDNPLIYLMVIGGLLVIVVVVVAVAFFIFWRMRKSTHRGAPGVQEGDMPLQASFTKVKARTESESVTDISTLDQSSSLHSEDLSEESEDHKQPLIKCSIATKDGMSVITLA